MNSVKSLLLRHWRGDSGQMKSFFVNGLVFYFVLVFALVGASNFIKAQAFFYFGIGLFITYTVWMVVGNIRCSIKIFKNDQASILSKWFAFLVLLTMAAIVFFSLRDGALFLR